MGLIARMRALRIKLLQVRLGPGAAELPLDVKRIHLEFSSKFYGGHHGARKFWRQYLPRLKYHNPTVSMTVNRTTDGPDAATMTVFFEFVNQESPAGASGYERTTIIDMLDKQDSRILRELLEKTGAKDIKATEEEERELQQLAEERVKSEQDRARVKLEQDARRREKQMLERARGLGTASNA